MLESQVTFLFFLCFCVSGTDLHYFLLFDVFCSAFTLFFSPSVLPSPPPPISSFHFFFIYLVDIASKELSRSLDLTRSSSTKCVRKTRYYVLSYTICNRPSNLVTTVQFKPGLKATKIAPNAN